MQWRVIFIFSHMLFSFFHFHTINMHYFKKQKARKRIKCTWAMWCWRAFLWVTAQEQTVFTQQSLKESRHLRQMEGSEHSTGSQAKRFRQNQNRQFSQVGSFWNLGTETIYPYEALKENHWGQAGGWGGKDRTGTGALPPDTLHPDWLLPAAHGVPAVYENGTVLIQCPSQ